MFYNYTYAPEDTEVNGAWLGQQLLHGPASEHKAYLLPGAATLQQCVQSEGVGFLH